MDSVVKEQSKAFAVRIVRLYRYLCEEKKEWILSKQLLRSGTSIGANIVEAQAAISKKDFLAKIYIAFKECLETEYWLELLHDTDYLNEDEFNSISQDNIALKKMLSSITITTTKNLKKGKLLTPHS